MNQLKTAIEISEKAHKGQKRWDGKPYITHPKEVAKLVDGIGLKIVAWLHDVLEDTKITPEDLLERGIDIRLVISIENLTRKKGMNYKDFILQIKEDEIATKVKIADLTHNISNLKEGSMKDKYRLAKYILMNNQNI